MKIILPVLILAVLISGCIDRTDRTTLDVSIHSSDDYTSQHIISGVNVSGGIAKVDINITIVPRKLFNSYMPSTDVNLSCFETVFDDNPVTIEYYKIYEMESKIIKDSSGVYYIPRLYVQSNYNYSALKAFIKYRCYPKASTIIEPQIQVYYDGVLTKNKTMYIDAFRRCNNVVFEKPDYSDRELEYIYSDSSFGIDCKTMYTDSFTFGIQLEEMILSEAKKL